MKKAQRRRTQIKKRINAKPRPNYSEQLRKNIANKYKESDGFDQYCWDQNYDFMIGLTDEEYEKRIEDLCSSDAMIKKLFE